MKDPPSSQFQVRSSTFKLDIFAKIVENRIYFSKDPALKQMERKVKAYKVISQKDKWFSRKFDPETLEQAMNSYASRGWQVISVATASIPGFGGNREELIVIFEREA